MQNISLGKLGERIAANFLSAKGFKILEMNFQKHWGELDIIAIDPSTGLGQSSTLVFVEVKTRMENDRYSPEEAMTPWKIASVRKSGLFYKNLHPELPELLRIDFVGIVLDANYKPLKINHIESIS